MLKTRRLLLEYKVSLVIPINPRCDLEAVRAPAARVSSTSIMALRRLFQLSSLFRSAVTITLRRNIGLSAVVFNKAKDLDPVQKLFLDKIREYNTKSKSVGGVVDAGPAYQKNLMEEMTKLQRLYGGGDLTQFPQFKFPEPKLEEVTTK
ncbi:ATP synthase-coupling factor 6, mitochondrial [Myxocyprinus asiaticus]|uniref:ATP synthase-coupling factor 6, mitochondrial n=1 Tax=Myxocyprinus asiaticus TaxID=70543 RepID=UPI002222D73F|nr:ATP synthase-coupling factor 6, mitochondrial [Myxocyprinus asiaticus]